MPEQMTDWRYQRGPISSAADTALDVFRKGYAERLGRDAAYSATRKTELLRLASECEGMNIPEAAAILREEAVKIR